MEGIASFIVAKAADIADRIHMAAAEVTTATTEDNRLQKLFDSSDEAEKFASNIMDWIYILIAMVIVVAIFTVTLYIFKFFRNRRDPNYRKNDDNFLDD